MRALGATVLSVGALVYACALTVVSVMPSRSGASDGWDSRVSSTTQNVLHVPAYAGLVVLVGLSLLAWGRASSGALLKAGAICGGYGLLMEGLQTVIPGRMATWPDGLMNAAGVALGLSLILLWRRSRKGRTVAARPATATAAMSERQ